MSIENPEFYVFYNGKDKFPAKKTIKLSDLYRVKSGKKPNLELIVTVYNVNHGQNKNIMKQSKTLNEYAMFIAKVREYENDGFELTEALQKTVEHCIKNDILKEFLQAHGGEVVSILRREWNLDDALRVREEERAEDIAENLLDILDIETIAEKTGLTIEKVKKIAEKYNKDK